jgi:hypothetical protein
MSKVFEPGWGNPSLRTIFETTVPESISMVPSTPGWWFLLFVFIGVVVRAVLNGRQRYLRDKYRREALAQLVAIKSSIKNGAVEAARELAPLLRATAIAAIGREAVIELEGNAYVDVLSDLAPKADLISVSDLHQLAYAPVETFEEIDIEALLSTVEHWIRTHRRLDA